MAYEPEQVEDVAQRHERRDQRILAAVRGLHRMAFRLKIKTKSLRKVRFIFDNQDSAHAR